MTSPGFYFVSVWGAVMMRISSVIFITVTKRRKAETGLGELSIRNTKEPTERAPPLMGRQQVGSSESSASGWVDGFSFIFKLRSLFFSFSLFTFLFSFTLAFLVRTPDTLSFRVQVAGPRQWEETEVG